MGGWGAIAGAALGGIIAGPAGAAVGGSVGGGLDASAGASKANKQAETLANENRQYETDMANTAHQREVADLKAAGLNPILSANSGASTPNTSSVTPQNSKAVMAQISNIATSTALQAAQAKTAQANADVARDVAQATKTKAQMDAATAFNSARIAKVDADIIDSPGGKVMRGTKMVTDAIKPILDTVQSFGNNSARNAANNAQADYYNRKR